MLKGSKVNLKERADRSQCLSHSIKERLGVEVVLRLEPLVFQLAPQHFGDVEVRRIRRQIKEKQATLLPRLTTLSNLFCDMSRRIVQDHNRDALQAPGQVFELLHNKARIDGVVSGLKATLIGARQQSKTVQTTTLSAGHKHVFVLELPRIRHARLQRHAAFITVIQVQQTLLAHLLQ